MITDYNNNILHSPHLCPQDRGSPQPELHLRPARPPGLPPRPQRQPLLLAGRQEQLSHHHVGERYTKVGDGGKCF